MGEEQKLHALPVEDTLVMFSRVKDSLLQQMSAIAWIASLSSLSLQIQMPPSNKYIMSASVFLTKNSL